MGLIWTPQKRTRQPQGLVGIDWSNPLTRGLAFAFNPSGALDVVRGRRPLDGTLKKSVGQIGVSCYFDGTNSLDFGSWDEIDGLVNCTYWCHFIPGTQANSYAAPFAKTFNNATAPPYGSFWIELQGSTAYIQFGTNTGVTIGGSFTYGVGTQYLLIGKWSAAVGGVNNCSTYKNGVKISDLGAGSGTTNLKVGSAPSNGLLLGGRNSTTADGGSNKFVGHVFSAGVFNRALSEAEVKSLSDKPWQIFAPDEIPIWFTDASGDLDITATRGDAAAIGYAATVDAQTAITAAIGTAAATGYAATVDRSLSITATCGTAAGVGYSAGVAINTDIAGARGDAAAVGYAADVAFGDDLNISANVGTASATGYAATLDLQITIAATRGDAAALGYAATVSDEDPLHGFTQDQLDFLVSYMEANMSIPTASEIAAAVLAALQSASPVIPVNVEQVHGIDVEGSGTEADPWGPA